MTDDSTTCPDATPIWLDRGNVTLHGSVSGKGATGLVLVHELGGTQHSFDALLPLLEAQFRILRFDQRGAGLSEKPRQPFAIGDLAEDLQALARHAELPSPYWVLGAAAGAAVALDHALRHPGSGAGLIFCAPALSVDTARRDYLESRAALAANDGMRVVCDATLERSYPNELRADASRFTRYRNQLLGCDPVGYALANRALIDYGGATALTEVDVPCLVIGGGQDPLRPPPMVRAIASALRRGRTIEIDSGHLMSWQSPHQVADAVLAFVNAHSLGETE